MPIKRRINQCTRQPSAQYSIYIYRHLSLHSFPACSGCMLRFSGPFQADPPLGTATDPQPQPQTHPRQRHRSNLLVQTEGGGYCRETKLCLRPSSDETLPLRIPAETTDGRDGLFGNVHLHSCQAAYLNAHANAFAERWVRTIKTECLSKLILFGEVSLRRAVTQFLEHYKYAS
jgi:hypothetical protein